MDQQLVRQCVDIDISKESFTACVCSYFYSGEEQLTEVVEFKNQKTGFNQLVKWSRKITSASVAVAFVMEATGVYYEALAYHLHRLNQPVSVLLPNKVKYFAKSWNVKTKTNSVDARIIARMGAERKLSLWEPPLPIFKQLRDLTRAYSELMKEKEFIRFVRYACLRLRSLHSLTPTVIWLVVIGAALRAAPITVSEPVFGLKSLSQYYHPKAVCSSPPQLRG